MLKRTAYSIVVAAIAAVVAGGIAMPHFLPSSADADATGPVAIAAGTDQCGVGWPASGRKPTSGAQTFRITNTSIAGVEVQLEDPSTGAVFLDVEGLGAGASQDYSLRLDAGRYQFRCLPADSDTITGPVVTVTGQKHVDNATPGIVPVTRNDLIPAAKSYGQWIESRLPVLAHDVQQLDADIRAGDRAAAERDWTTAHMEYEQLGAAYGAFGEANTAIDGTPASGTTALSDTHLTGFHRIEALLWSGAALSGVAPGADLLVQDVAHLEQTFPTAQIDPLDIGLRAHEILENALQFEATGSTDAGSHTNLATIAANIQGTEHALAPLEPILQSRDRQLSETTASLTALGTLVDSYHQPNGTWTALDALTQPQREQLNAHLDASIELLADVAAICDIRRTS